MKYDILGVNVNNATMDEAIAELSAYIDTTDAHMVVTPNAEILFMCHEDEELKKMINSASFVAPDGIGVVYAAKSYGTPLKEKVPGCELGYNLLFEAAKKGAGVFLFGAKPGVADMAAKNLKEKVPNLIISGTRDGYFKPEDEPEIIKQINDSGAKILWVCLGAPRQEKWMYAHRDELNVGVMLGLGGSMDVYAGTVNRAPKIFIKLGCEWLYRLIKEPWRLGRMMKIPKVLRIAKKDAKRRKKDARA